MGNKTCVLVLSSRQILMAAFFVAGSADICCRGYTVSLVWAMILFAVFLHPNSLPVGMQYKGVTQR